MNNLKKFFARFWRNKNASVTVETVIIFTMIGAPFLFYCFQFMQLNLGTLYTRQASFYSSRAYVLGAGNSRFTEDQNKKRAQLAGTLSIMPAVPSFILLAPTEATTSSGERMTSVHLMTKAPINMDPFRTFGKHSMVVHPQGLDSIGMFIEDMIIQALGGAGDSIGEAICTPIFTAMDNLGHAASVQLGQIVDNAINNITINGVTWGRLLNGAIETFSGSSCGTLMSTYVFDPLIGWGMDFVKPYIRNFVNDVVNQYIYPYISAIERELMKTSMGRLLNQVLRAAGYETSYMEIHVTGYIVPARMAIDYGI